MLTILFFLFFVYCNLVSIPVFLWYSLPLFLDTEFWKQVPPNEPYRVILGDVRDKLYHTRERSRQLLASGHSDIPEEAALTNVEQVLPFLRHFLTYSLPVIFVI